MDREQKKLQKSLQRRRTPEEQKRLKQESQRRRAQDRPPRRPVDWDGDEETSFERMSRPKTPPAPRPAAGGREALVVAVHPSTVAVEIEGAPMTAHLAPGVDEIVIGDRVRVATGATGQVSVRERLERRTTLSRPDPANPRRERVLAANVDRAVVVASIVQPPLRLGLLDRFLLAIERGGIQPVVVLNKVDLATADAHDEARSALAPYAAAGAAIVSCSATTGEGVDDLRREIAQRTVVFVGHSGVGKSSLVAAIAPEAAPRTGEVRAFDGKGRHTTTSSSLVTLADGTRIVDTPGIREMGLWRIDAVSLAGHFPDFASCGPCRFRDCSHVAEPDCAVREAAHDGRLARSRYDAYLRIRATLD